MEEKKLELLADHYKDTHTILRAREEQRDKLLLYAISAVGLLAFAVLSPAILQGLFKEVEISGAKMDVSAVPVAVVASVAWTLLLVFLLRCYQAAVTIDRDYNFLHEVEDQIASQFGKGPAFRREGWYYKTRKPPLTHWAWILYTVLLPLLLLFVAVHLLGVEYGVKTSWNWRFDTSVGLAVLVTLLTYVIPQIKRRIERLAEARKKKGS